MHISNGGNKQSMKITYSMKKDCPGYDIKLHPGVPLSKDSTLFAPRARVTVKLSAAGQWMIHRGSLQCNCKNGSMILRLAEARFNQVNDRGKPP